MVVMRGRRLVMIVVSVVALIFVSPVLVRVYSELGAVVTLSPWWLLAIVTAVTVQLFANWELHRIILRTDNRADIAAAQLAGNAASHLLPGGNAIGAGVHLRMMTVAGFPMTRTATALGTVSVIGAVSGLIVLPIIVLIASAFGSDVDPTLVGGMWAGAGGLLVVLVALAIAITRDAPWRWTAKAIASVQRRFRRESDATELRTKMLTERDLIARALREHPVQVLLIDFVRAFGDYLALYFALRATGAHVNPAAALAAFIVSNVAGMIPFTPGGLGFVEAGLAGVLIVAGATDDQATLTVATYRVAATWLPCLAAGFALLWFQRRHRDRRLREVLVAPHDSPAAESTT